MLHNAVYSLHRGHATLQIADVDDVCLDKQRLHLVLQQLSDKGSTILLAHGPDFGDIAVLSDLGVLLLSPLLYLGTIITAASTERQHQQIERCQHKTK